MGMFGIAEVVYNLEQRSQDRQVFTSRLGSVLPGWADLSRAKWAIVRGTALGSLLGILPGGGALLASFAAYAIEKKVARPPRELGEGDIRGVEQHRNPPTMPARRPVVHPDADARRAVQPDHGADDRRA